MMGCLVEIVIRDLQDEPAKTLRFLYKQKSLSKSVLHSKEVVNGKTKVRIYLGIGPNKSSEFCKRIESRNSIARAKVIS
jgi:hypothetical protein